MNYDVVPLFSLPLYCSNIGDISDLTLSKIPHHDYRAIVSSNLVHITHDENILENYPELEEQIYLHFNTYVDKVLNIDLTQIKFKISDAWLLKTYPKGNAPAPHNHPNSLFSGVIYLDAKGKGGINFIKQMWACDIDVTNFELPYRDNSNIYSSKLWTHTPENGDIIIFPSSVLHNINYNDTKQSRYCLAFNMIPTGTIGSRTGSKLYYT